MLLDSYTEKVREGELRDDAAQAIVVAQLDKLAQDLEARERRGAIGKLLGKNGTPKGIYIYGDVGRGKTMLMDLFFAALDSEGQAAHPLPCLHAGYS